MQNLPHQHSALPAMAFRLAARPRFSPLVAGLGWNRSCLVSDYERLAGMSLE